MDDNAAAMLSALLSNGPSQESPQIRPEISLEEQKKYLRDNVSLIDVAGRRDIGNILIINNLRGLIKPCFGGVIIDLDTVPDHLISDMYFMLTIKINCRK